MADMQIKTFKVPYAVSGEGENAELKLNDGEKELVETENLTDSQQADIMKLSTRIANENSKEKNLAHQIGGDGFLKIKYLTK